MISTWGATGGLKPAMSLNLLSGAISSLVNFSRSTVATVTDFEGVIKNTKINEARFDGMRRVENLYTSSNTIPSGYNITAITNIATAPDNSTTASLLTCTSSTLGTATYQYFNSAINTTYTLSAYVKAGTSQYCCLHFEGGPNVTQVYNVVSGGGGGLGENFVAGATINNATITYVGSDWYRLTLTTTFLSAATPNLGSISFAPLLTGNSVNAQKLPINNTIGNTLYAWGWQLENVTGQANQNPSEYISTNVLSYPYQGAGVDGVQYFNYTNPNCAINGVLTQIPTIPINSSNSKWAYNCTTTGDYFSTPSSTANRITGNLSLLAQVALDNWTPTTVQCLIVKDGVSAGTRSWAFNVQASGVLRLNISFNGTALFSYDSTVATGFTDRTVHYVGVQRESSTGIIKFYTSEDGRTFTQLGANVASTAGALYDATTQPVQFGNLSGLSFALDGKIYDSHVYSGLKFTGTSTLVMDFDPSNWTTGTTFTGLETGEVWTLNGNAKIYQGLWDATGPSSLLIEEQRINSFATSTAPTTQSVTTTATPYTLSFYGSGTITLSGSFVAVVAGSNAYTRTTLTFTPTAAVLVMTITGTITKPQLEVGSFATSYIENTTTQTTRTADQASMTGTNFSSWYNQAQGSFYVDMDSAGTTGVKFSGIYAYGADLTSFINLTNSNLSTFLIYTSGFVTQASFSATLASTVKIAGSYAPNNFNCAFNGVSAIADTSGSLPNPVQLFIGWNQVNTQGAMGHIRKINYYATALPSAVLQSLTS